MVFFTGVPFIPLANDASLRGTAVEGHWHTLVCTSGRRLRSAGKGR